MCSHVLGWTSTWWRATDTSRTSTSASTVARALPGDPTFSATRCSMASSAVFPAKTATRSSRIPATCSDTSAHRTWAPAATPAPSVGKPLPHPAGWSSTRTSTALSSHSAARSASRATPSSRIYVGTNGCTPTVACRSSVTSVVRPSAQSPHCPSIAASATQHPVPFYPAVAVVVETMVSPKWRHQWGPAC